MSVTVTSPSFKEGETIPVKFTGEGDNASPKLEWSVLPQGTVSVAIICDDPDAPRGTWVHWVLYNLPATTTSLPEGVPATENLPDGSKQGLNDANKFGYTGPMPPVGHGKHRYYFKVYALNKQIDLPSKAVKADLVKAMEGAILAEGQLMGVYERK